VTSPSAVLVAASGLKARLAEADAAEPASGAVQRPAVPDAVRDHRGAHDCAQQQSRGI
jgi:hypothetical protein